MRRSSALARTMTALGAALAPLPRQSQAQHWQMLNTAFAPMRLHAPPCLLPLLGGMAAYALDDQPWLLAWVLLTLAGIAACRQCAMAMAHSGRESAPSLWAARYMLCALGEAASLGLGGACAAASGNDVTTILIASALGFTAAGATRSAIFTRLAQAQILLLLAPLAIACLIQATPTLLAVSIMAALQAAFATVMAAETEPDGASLRASAAARAPAVLLAEGAASFQEVHGRDAATGLPSRPRFLHTLAQEGQRAMTSMSPLSVLLIQCDTPVVTPGTVALLSPRLIAGTVQCLKSALARPGDMLASLGDGKFGALLPFTDALGCATVGNKLLAAGRSRPDMEGEAAPATIILSIGMATYAGHGEISTTRLIENAETALAHARKHGGDRACRLDPMIETLRPQPYTGVLKPRPPDGAAATAAAAASISAPVHNSVVEAQ